MQGETRERWKQLCEQAAIEQDSHKLVQLIREINNLLEEKRLRVSKKEDTCYRDSASNPVIPSAAG